MQATTHGSAMRIALPVLLLAGWVAGLLGQRQGAIDTGYMDITPPLMVLGLSLLFLGGATARILRPASRRLRTGVLAGLAVLASMIAGYWVLALVYIDRPFGEQGGETWFSFLLESWFWIGVPLLLGSMLGAAGWMVSDLLARARRR